MSTVPTAVWSGTFNVWGVQMKCHVLDNGQRIIEAESMDRFLESLARPGVDVGDITDFVKWQRGH